MFEICSLFAFICAIFFFCNNIRYPLSIMAIVTKEKKKSKADWDDVTIDVFVKICVNETFAGTDQIVTLIRLGEKKFIIKFLFNDR